MDINQQFSPGLLSFTDQSDFDYGAFLQGDEIGFPESVQGNATNAGGFSDDSGKATPPSSDNRSTSNASTEVVSRVPAQKQRLERRGHTKSRRGCYNCKRRRIKVFRPYVLVVTWAKPLPVPGDTSGLRPLCQDRPQV